MAATAAASRQDTNSAPQGLAKTCSPASARCCAKRAYLAHDCGAPAGCKQVIRLPNTRYCGVLCVTESHIAAVRIRRRRHRCCCIRSADRGQHLTYQPDAERPGAQAQRGLRTVGDHRAQTTGHRHFRLRFDVDFRSAPPLRWRCQNGHIEGNHDAMTTR